MVEILGPLAPEGTGIFDWAVGMGRDVRRAWQECPRAVWMQHLATALGADVSAIVRAVTAAPLALSEASIGQMRRERGAEAATTPRFWRDLDANLPPATRQAFLDAETEILRRIRAEVSLDELLASRSARPCPECHDENVAPQVLP